MIHYGDITKINGHEVPLVDVVTGGSPCQDLSVAGKRAGLDGERSGLFMEQIRLIKEMRDASARELQLRGSDEPIRPRYMVWENVPGAFSSNQGEDFRCVLEETAKIVDKNASIPRLEGGQSGHHQDAFWVMGGVLPGAYMMHSFGECPKEENVSRLSQILEGQPHPKYCLSAKACQGILNRAERRGKELPELLRKTLLRQSLSKSDQVNQEGAKESSSNMSEQEPCQPSITNPSCLNPWDVQSKHIQPENGKAEALYSGECRGGGGESYVMQEPVYCLQGNGIDRADTAGCNGKGWKEDESYTLNTVDRHAICIGNGQVHDAISPSEELSKTLNCMDDPMKVVTFSDTHNALNARDGESGVHSQMLNEPENNFVVSYGLDRASFNQGKNALYDFSVEEETAQTLVARGPGGGTSETVGALCASDYKGVGNQYVNDGKCIVQRI